MQFTVGDKIVDPRYGPGRITGMSDTEIIDGATRYYVIEILGHGLTLHMPVLKAEQVGIRLAMSQSRAARVLGLLRGTPRVLPEDYHARQDQIWTKLKTGKVAQLTGVVRDLTWHRKLSHVTKKDMEYLRQGRELLAREMALASGGAVTDMSKLIDTTLAAALAGASTSGE